MMQPRIREAVLDAAGYDESYLSDAGVRIRMHRNESALPAPAHVIAALRAMDGELLRRYPADLQRDVASALAARIGISRSYLALAGGADEILGALARAFVDPGETIVTARPTFGMYAHIAAVSDARLCEVPYERRWQLDPPAFAAAADDRTRLVILGHPNNPTGEPLRREDVIAIARALPGAVIAIDEVYLSLSDRSFASLAKDTENIVVVGSLSKVAALAGMRIGYAVACERIASALRRVIQPFPLSVASLVAANAYLRGGAQTRAFDEALAAQTRRSLDAIVEEIGRFAISIWRGPANFVLMDFGAGAQIIEEALVRNGIGARAYSESELKGCLRFCAADDASTGELIDVVRSAMAVQSGVAVNA